MLSWKQPDISRRSTEAGLASFLVATESKLARPTPVGQGRPNLPGLGSENRDAKGVFWEQKNKWEETN